jgi:flavin reductase (DIM6/NTAB) family NADH-FMN oxidoreductase RutF
MPEPSPSRDLDLVTLAPGVDPWRSAFLVAPLVLIGTREPTGAVDLAPKHMVTPLGWGPYFGFVCTPRHATYRNIERTGEFTVSWPRPDQLLLSSLAASPRCEDESKPALGALPTFPATRVDGALLQGGYFFLECHRDRIIEGFGENHLVVGRIVATHVARDALRTEEGDGQDVIYNAPLLAYVAPGRWAKIDRTFSFPEPAGFRR